MRGFIVVMGRTAAPFLITILAFYGAFNYLESKKEPTPAAVGIDEVLERDIERLRLQKAIVDGFQEKKELITLEVQLSETALWDESWGELSLLHKSQRVRFFATGIFICPLEEVDGSAITVNHRERTVNVTIPKPEIKEVIIDETKTRYESVSRGWLRRGTVKLTPQQHGAMYYEIKKSMKAKMESEEIIKQAEINTKKAVKEIFTEILAAVGANYTVDVHINR